MTTVETPFEIGKAWIAYRSQPTADSQKKVALIATGPLLYQALLAARALEKDGVAATVVNVHTIKPLDEETTVALVKECGAIVTVEEHQVAGGLGGAIAELLSAHCPLPTACIGVQDRFGQSGTMSELYEEYGLTAPHIVAAVQKVLARQQ
jgi:transketolase